ncbi:heme ABC exporter ATP-binding protein CcmA [Pelagibacterium lentulum]|uniref:Cytochrome c biogenesis ATP-binding export protein CcmA n=1 Tax=Pelagibacterium lentulum TaxID=2029865 RepID=A0A916R5H1_9HYPH|nr:heme ABC exporter ATP-binding protein CcmA [Pelagibacterium lentulum]GGA36896.1 cytochrome c biogenesis ATP-binding export protein CcmA [Pelagibacterium lentulum]
MDATPRLPQLSLRIDNVTLTRGEFDLFENLSAMLTPGEALVLKGANGAGKSSALLALAGQLPIKSGEIQWLGLGKEEAADSQMHLIGHLPAIQRGLTVRENLAFWTALYDGDEAILDSAIAAAGLSGLEHLSCSVLSAGQTRRLALARLVAIPRPIWLLDEPTSALDAEGSLWVETLIGAHLAAGGLAVIATHLALGIEREPNVKVKTLSEFTL